MFSVQLTRDQKRVSCVMCFRRTVRSELFLCAVVIQTLIHLWDVLSNDTNPNSVEITNVIKV